MTISTDMDKLRRRGLRSQNDPEHKHGVQASNDTVPGFNVYSCLCWSAAIFLVTPVVAFLVISLTFTSPIEPVGFKMPPIPPFKGPLMPNDNITNAEKIFLNELHGAESLAIKDGHIYSGTADGKIVDLDLDTKQIRVVVEYFGEPPCGKVEYEKNCGRPLGVRFGKDGFLYTVDSYLGLFKVDVNTGTFENLVSEGQLIDGLEARFLNDLDITAKGVVYMSDTTTRWPRSHFQYDGLEAIDAGRVLRYDPQTKEVSTLIPKMFSPNGIQLAGDDSFLLIAESTRSAVRKYYLKGPKAGTLEMFNDHLPGLPDNIRPSSNGGYWVAFALARPDDQFLMWDFAAENPWLRLFLSKVFSRQIAVSFLWSKYCLGVEIDKNGKIINSIHDPDTKTMKAISEIADDNGILYLGSFSGNFIGQIDMRQK